MTTDGRGWDERPDPTAEIAVPALSPRSWYKVDPDGPGTFPAEGAPTRVLGGALDGERHVWPRHLYTLQIPISRPIVGSALLAEIDYDVEVYSLHQRVVEPGADCEGPIGIEWVWMTQQSFLEATGALTAG